MNVLKTELHQVFNYDFYSDITDILSETPVDGDWKATERMVFFWSLIEGEKVSICHNGKTICVSPSAVKAHLAHGDKLGSCDEEAFTRDNSGNSKAGEKDAGEAELIQIGISPNPADRMVRIRFEKPGHLFTAVYLISSGGTPVDFYNASNLEELTIQVSHLKSGIYYLRFTGEEGEVWKTFIRK